jgi:hypothetical protein
MRDTNHVTCFAVRYMKSNLETTFRSFSPPSTGFDQAPANFNPTAFNAFAEEQGQRSYTSANPYLSNIFNNSVLNTGIGSPYMSTHDLGNEGFMDMYHTFPVNHAQRQMNAQNAMQQMEQQQLEISRHELGAEMQMQSQEMVRQSQEMKMLQSQEMSMRQSQEMEMRQSQEMGLHLQGDGSHEGMQNFNGFMAHEMQERADLSPPNNPFELNFQDKMWDRHTPDYLRDQTYTDEPFQLQQSFNNLSETLKVSESFIDHVKARQGIEGGQGTQMLHKREGHARSRSFHLFHRKPNEHKVHGRSMSQIQPRVPSTIREWFNMPYKAEPFREHNFVDTQFDRKFIHDPQAQQQRHESFQNQDSDVWQGKFMKQGVTGKAEPLVLERPVHCDTYRAFEG